jgi:ubiquinone/menaquinone biosynthesis C-methylase UbiE
MVFEKDSLHHVNKPKVVLREMGRVSKKMIVLVEGNRYNPFSFFWMVKIREHNHFTLSQLKTFIQTELGTATIKMYQKEAHYAPLPINSKFLVSILDKFQDILEKFLKKLALANYNVVILEKKVCRA